MTIRTQGLPAFLSRCERETESIFCWVSHIPYLPDNIREIHISPYLDHAAGTMQGHGPITRGQWKERAPASSGILKNIFIPPEEMPRPAPGKRFAIRAFYFKKHYVTIIAAVIY
ncbi:hypothetical protein [Komagataeibacter kakiaceti]|uniref:hypothetical protein n=1 Tax=Komagataeibacter kakiaceti TaxID=943261 RepID=UPI00161033BF|nr:hypothetical protein [Komagataeibacter kakiaceti]